MPRDPLPTWFFVVVVVRRGAEFLLVRERKHGQLWYLPAGRVEPGETLAAAAERETLEEARIGIVLEGLLRVEHTPRADGTARVRVLFTARPRDQTPPKQRPDGESLGAAWVSLAQMAQLPLRGPEVLRICEHAARGGEVYPLSILTMEGAAFPDERVRGGGSGASGRSELPAGDLPASTD